MTAVPRAYTVGPLAADRYADIGALNNIIYVGIVVLGGKRISEGGRMVGTTVGVKRG